MARKESTDASEAGRLLIFQLAEKLVKNGEQLRRLREKLGATRTDWARFAGISTQQVTSYERSGPYSGNFWIFCKNLQSFGIDPGVLNDPDFLDGLPDLDPSDRLKGGKINERDRWYEFGGRKYEKFRRWAHRKHIEKRPREEREKPLSCPEIERWLDEWKRVGKPDANEVIERGGRKRGHLCSSFADSKAVRERAGG